MTREVFGGIGGARFEDEAELEEDATEATEATDAVLEPLATEWCRGGRRGMLGGMSDIARRRIRSLWTCYQSRIGVGQWWWSRMFAGGYSPEPSQQPDPRA